MRDANSILQNLHENSPFLMKTKIIMKQFCEITNVVVNGSNSQYCFAKLSSID